MPGMGHGPESVTPTFCTLTRPSALGPPRRNRGFLWAPTPPQTLRVGGTGVCIS